MPRRARPSDSPLSVKSQRWLRAARIEESLAAGETPVPIGRRYRLRDGQLATLAFARDDEQRLCVGYAVIDEANAINAQAVIDGKAVNKGSWVMVESEPFSARALGYYERWLKRHRESE